MIYYPEGVNDALCKTFESIDEVKQSMVKGEVLESRVLLCDREHNLHVELGAVKGIIPYREGALGIQEGTIRDIALISKVNKRVCFKIIGFHRDENGNMVAVLSRRMVQLECMKNYIDNLLLGDIIQARVTHLEKFGAFIDIGAGINSLIPIDMLSVSRITNPRERLWEGELIRCALKKREESKLTFTLKELLGTWSENANMFCVGETVTGVVRSIETYGVFVELMPNLAGLAEPCEKMIVGQSVSVFIKSINPERMKIKLVVVETFDDIAPTSELVYFEQSNHITKWTYSPPNATKFIETQFE
jgi:small subunit ribosomal protein S1